MRSSTEHDQKCSDGHRGPQPSFQLSLNANDQTDFNRAIAIDLNNTGSDIFELGDDLAAMEMYQEAIASLMKSLKPEERAFSVPEVSGRAQLCQADKIEAAERRRRELASEAHEYKRPVRRKLLQLDLFQRTECTCDSGPQPILDSMRIPTEKTQLRDTDIDSSIIAYNMALVHLLRPNPIDSFSFNLFQISLSMAPNFEDNCGHGTLVSPATLNNMGTLHYQNGLHDEALSCFTDALRLCRLALNFPRVEIQGAEYKLKLHKYIGTISSNIARVYYIRCQYIEAAEMCKESLSARRIVVVQRSKVVSTDKSDIDAEEDLVATLYNLGVIHHHLGELEKSMEFYQDFVDRTKTLSSRNEACTTIEQGCLYCRDLVTALCDILLINFQLNILKKSSGTRAIEMTIKQLQLTRAEFGYDHQDLPSLLCQVGSYLVDQVDCHNALSFFNEALRVEKSQDSPSVDNIVITLNFIGQTHQQNNELNQAMRYFFEAVTLLSAENHRRGPQQDYVFSVILYNMGMIHHKAGSYDQANQAFEKALTLCNESCAADNAAGLAAMLHNIGIAQLAMKKVLGALKSFNMSLDLRVSLFGQSSSQVAESLYQIAHIHNATGKTCLALKLYTKTVEIEKETLGHFHPDVVVTLCSIGQIYHSEGALEKALNVYIEAQGILRRVLDLDLDNTMPLSISSILNIIGDIYLELGELTKAIEAFAEAVNMTSDSNSPNNHQEQDFSHVFRNKLAHPEIAAAA